MSPTSQQVRAAGETVAALNTHQGNGPGCPWSADSLNREAEALEAEEKEAAELEAVAQVLARELRNVTLSIGDLRDVTLSLGHLPADQAWVIRARTLIESGWRKEGLDV